MIFVLRFGIVSLTKPAIPTKLLLHLSALGRILVINPQVDNLVETVRVKLAVLTPSPFIYFIHCIVAVIYKLAPLGCVVP